MLAIQSPGSRHRGIGRIALGLTTALLKYSQGGSRSSPNVEYVLYFHEGLPDADVPPTPNATRRTLRRQCAGERATAGGIMEALARETPDGLDLLLVLNPFEVWADYRPPIRPLDGPPVAAVIYDLIPCLFQEVYLSRAEAARQYYRQLQTVRGYDRLLAISEATRADCLRVMGLDGRRVVTVAPAADDRGFVPDATEPLPAESRAVLGRLGVARPFVFCVGSMDRRKNMRGVIDAFALLPEPLRTSHQLALTCGSTQSELQELRRHAASRGVAGALVLTGEFRDDQTLRVLYQRCSAFLMPSLYEGFGLSLLEALHCGAPVIAGNNSSQPEVVGDAGLLVNPSSPDDIAAKLARVLSEPGLAGLLRSRSGARAQQFAWRQAAGLAIDALTSLVNRRAGRARRPRVALFAPLPPQVCGEADHALRLAGALKATSAVDLFHESGYGPEVPDDFACYDYRLFHRFAAARSYHGVLYHMGNTYQEQRFVYESLRRYPGVVTLHDFCLSGFFWEWSRRTDARSWPTSFWEEVRHFAPDMPGELVRTIALWNREPGGLPEVCARRGIYLNRRIFEHAAHVVVHSRWCLEQAQRLFPEHAERVSLIPLGAALGDRSAAQRTAIRNRFGVPGDALVFGSYGILGRGKMNEEAVQAFAQVAHEFPRAVFLFVGPDFGQGAAREAADALGLGNRIRILGRLADADYDDLVAVTDVGVNLRRPPTYGETSGSLLDLLRFGVAAVVTDTGSFSELPDGIVRKVRWSADGLAALTDAFRELSRDHTLRARMGRAARQHIQQSHAWSRVGALYTEVIERSHARTRPRGLPQCPPTVVFHLAGLAGVAPRAY